MREIKFRAWEKKSLIMRLWCYLRDIDYTKQFALFDDSDFVFMQSTGLFDKNGKEIFEGDVCKLIFNIVVVDFTSGSFKFRRIDKEDVFFPVQNCHR